MILPDWKITELCVMWGLVQPFDPERVNPASVDLCIGEEIYDLTNAHRVHLPDVIRITPGVTLLVTTLETVRLPDHVAGQLILKSSMGRRGLMMPAAGWVDPGFCGQLTLQLSACVPVLLQPGQPFVQLVLYQMISAADTPYQGRYQGQNGVTLARDDGSASLNEVANEHVIYPQPGEGLSLNDSEWWDETPAYKLNDYTEGMAG